MRTRTFFLARVSLAGVLALGLGSCTPRALDRSYSERPVFVELPASGVATPTQRAAYENNPISVERWERRCTYKPAAGATCNSSVDLKIVVFEGAKSVAAAARPARPLLLATIENKGTTATFDSIYPGVQALVAVGRQGQTVIMLVRFHQMANSPNFAVSAREYIVVKQCKQHYPANSSDMSFRGCPPEHLAMHGGAFEQRVPATSLVSFEKQPPWRESNQGHSTVDVPRSTSIFSLDDPLWLRCSPGCCTS
jgi:hypothetical protein